jgi:hypothetical protein
VSEHPARLPPYVDRELSHALLAPRRRATQRATSNIKDDHSMRAFSIATFLIALSATAAGAVARL